MTIELETQPLTRKAFADFGDVIDTQGVDPWSINEGTTQRFHDLANLDMGQGGKPLVSIFRATPRPLPIAIKMMERHPLASQAFMPLSAKPFLVVVAERGDDVKPQGLKAFLTNGRQGVNYAANIWHHPVLALADISDFLVIDRDSDGDNLEEFFFAGEDIIVNP